MNCFPGRVECPIVMTTSGIADAFSFMPKSKRSRGEHQIRDMGVLHIHPAVSGSSLVR